MKNLDKNQIIEFLNKDISSAKIDSRIMSLFLKQLSLLLSSGIPLDKSLKIIEEQKIDKKLTAALGHINSDLARGYSVYEAFIRSEKSFNPMVIAFIKSGDASGRLADVLDELSSYLAEESKTKTIIKNAMAYPIILLIVTIVIVGLVINFVLPTFTEVFDQQQMVLPLGTRILMGISSFFSNFGIFILLFILALALSLKILRHDDDFKLKMDKFNFCYLPFKKLRTLSLEYQFISLLYILKSGEIDIVTSLFIIRDSFKNTYIKQIIDKLIYDIRMGLSLAASLERAGIFTGLFVSMIRIGENSGQMNSSLKKSSEYYANDYLFKLQRLTSLVEPVMILLMSFIVGFVVFSIAIPIFDSVNAVNY